ncbi:hypothetical protein Ptr902_00189 [Pyrenophora tritici-repentis]|nr:hypothetical protein Ptr902_00189 [Pyrenophora tritici-repentis]
MCLFKTYETRGRTVVEPPPRRGNFTSHPPAGVMRLPREWRRSESYSDDGHFVEVRRSQPRVIEYYEEPRRSTTRHRKTDDIFPAEKRRETEDILKQLSVPYELCLYSHVEHGFGVKGDLSHARARFAKEQAFRQAVCWMDEYVKKDWREEDGRS